jgi:hypothetical protein
MTLLFIVWMDGIQDWPEEAKQYIRSLERTIESLTKEIEKIKIDFSDYIKRRPCMWSIENSITEVLSSLF